MKKHIPNIFTLANLLCGVMAIIHLLEGQEHWEIASYYIAAGALFDLMDGALARALGVNGELGKQLDSLADMVTFGVAPALIAREAIMLSLFKKNETLDFSMIESAVCYLPFLLIICSALRLAKFNIDSRQAKDFYGMPTPANALFWLSIPLITGGTFIKTDQGWLIESLMNPYVLSAAVVFLSLLMVSEVKIMSMKVDRWSIRGNEWRLILLLVSAVLLFIFRTSALPLVILFYLLLSLIRNVFSNEIQSSD